MRIQAARTYLGSFSHCGCIHEEKEGFVLQVTYMANGLLVSPVSIVYSGFAETVWMRIIF